jgi:hypothetical protein
MPFLFCRPKIYLPLINNETANVFFDSKMVLSNFHLTHHFTSFILSLEMDLELLFFLTALAKYISRRAGATASALEAITDSKQLPTRSTYRKLTIKGTHL